LQRSPLILSIGGVVFTANEVSEQAEVSSFFFRLKIRCLDELAHRWLPVRIEMTKLSRRLSATIDARAV